MARTSVSARKVTGGKTPRQQLRNKTARGRAEEVVAEAAKVVQRKNYARKTAGEPCTRKQLAGLSLINIDEQGDEGPRTVVDSIELDGKGLDGTGPEADIHDMVKSFT